MVINKTAKPMGMGTRTEDDDRCLVLRLQDRRALLRMARLPGERRERRTVPVDLPLRVRRLWMVLLSATLKDDLLSTNQVTTSKITASKVTVNKITASKITASKVITSKANLARAKDEGSASRGMGKVKGTETAEAGERMVLEEL